MVSPVCATFSDEPDTVFIEVMEFDEDSPLIDVVIGYEKAFFDKQLHEKEGMKVKVFDHNQHTEMQKAEKGDAPMEESEGITKDIPEDISEKDTEKVHEDVPADVPKDESERTAKDTSAADAKHIQKEDIGEIAREVIGKDSFVPELPADKHIERPDAEPISNEFLLAMAETISESGIPESETLVDQIEDVIEERINDLVWLDNYYSDSVNICTSSSSSQKDDDDVEDASDDTVAVIEDDEEENALDTFVPAEDKDTFLSYVPQAFYFVVNPGPVI